MLLIFGSLTGRLFAANSVLYPVSKSKSSVAFLSAAALGCWA